MPVICLASTKGGPGKTTLAAILAGTLAAEGVAVTAIDADPTEAFSRWAKGTYEGPKFEVKAEADETRLAYLISMAEGLVIVDTAGFGNRAATVAMTSADAVLVPMLSGEADINEAERTIRLVAGLSVAARREIPAKAVHNRVRSTTLARHAANEAASLPRLKAGLSDLVAYGEISFSGRLPASGKAADEIGALIAELRGLQWLPASSSKLHAGKTQAA